jgi:hypothetical protein
MTEFTKVEVARGDFIGWAPKPPQTVIVKVQSFDPLGGTDANDKPCPQMVGTLTEDTKSYRDNGATVRDLKAGDLVTVTAGIANLKAGLLAADPKPGDIVKMDFNDVYKTAKGTGKVIDVLIARASQAVTADDV